MTAEKQDSNDETELPKESSRITIHINISRELFRRLRIAASHNQLWLTEYVEQAVEEAALHEASIEQRQHRPITHEAIERLKMISEQIIQDRGGKLFEYTAEMIRQMREERSKYLEEL